MDEQSAILHQFPIDDQDYIEPIVFFLSRFSWTCDVLMLYDEEVVFANYNQSHDLENYEHAHM